MERWAYEKGLKDVGHGLYAYLQPDGSWGWSNAGLVTDGSEALLVDTLFDEALTADMLRTMKDAAGFGGKDIATLINTHANGDHTFGNRLVEGAEIIASKAGAEEMSELPPAALAEMMRAAPQMGELGQYLIESFGAFEFEGIPLTLPTRTFSGTLGVKVGNKPVELIEVGPAHTKGDILVHVPDDKTVFTGDILFIDSTPIIWAGPVSNWIAALDRILALEPEIIVPGHGPITDKAGVLAVRDYLEFCDREARARFDAGLSAEEAAFDIALGTYTQWADWERIAINVSTLYGHYKGEVGGPDIAALFTLMAKLKKGKPS